MVAPKITRGVLATLVTGFAVVGRIGSESAIIGNVLAVIKKRIRNRILIHGLDRACIDTALGAKHGEERGTAWFSNNPANGRDRKLAQRIGNQVSGRALR